MLVAVFTGVYNLRQIEELLEKEDMPPKAWKTLSSRPVYQNPSTISQGGYCRDAKRQDHRVWGGRIPDCVGILPFLDESHVLMVRQYRYVFGENQRWEMPTGGVKPAETLVDAFTVNSARKWGTMPVD